MSRPWSYHVNLHVFLDWFWDKKKKCSCVKQCFNNWDETNKRHWSQLPNHGASLCQASHVKTPDSLDNQWFNFKGVTSWIKYSELFSVGVVCCAEEVGFFWRGGGGLNKNPRIVYLIRAKLFVKIKHQPSIKFISLLSLSEDWTDCSSALLWFSTVYRM